jgi:hypothetical protein
LVGRGLMRGVTPASTRPHSRRDRLDHNQEWDRRSDREASVITAIPWRTGQAIGRPPGVYAGAQPGQSAGARHLHDYMSFPGALCAPAVTSQRDSQPRARLIIVRSLVRIDAGAIRESPQPMRSTPPRTCAMSLRPVAMSHTASRPGPPGIMSPELIRHRSESTPTSSGKSSAPRLWRTSTRPRRASSPGSATTCSPSSARSRPPRA